jgi:hypothetical protein
MIVSLVAVLAVSPAFAQECDGVGIFFSKAVKGGASDGVPKDITNDDAGTPMGIGQHVYLSAGFVNDNGDFSTEAEFIPEGCALENCEWKINSWTDSEGGISSDCNAPGSPDADASGSEVCYWAPSDLETCVSFDVDIRLDCSEAQVNDWGKTAGLVSVHAINIDGGFSSNDTPCSVSGGGCISPQSNGVASGWLLFPLLGLGGLARRRQD